MPYKISGTLSEACRIIVIEESGWTIESNTNESSGSYEIDSLVSGTKQIVARKSDGEASVYGNITPVSYTLPTGVIGGGADGVRLNVMDYITIGTTGNAQDFGDLTVAREGLGACSNGSLNRGCWCCGTTGSNSNVMDYANINTPGNASDFGDDSARRAITSTDNGSGDRALNAGGYISDYTNVIKYIAPSTLSNGYTFGNLTVARYDLDSCSNNTRAIFAAGRSDLVTYETTMDYVTISTLSSATDFGDLSSGRRSPGGCSNRTNDRGVFGGGNISAEGGYGTEIDYITISSAGNSTDFGSLSPGRREVCGTSDGENNRGIFAGGWKSPGVAAADIDYITINSTGNALDFGNLTDARKFAAACSNA